MVQETRASEQRDDDDPALSRYLPLVARHMAVVLAVTGVFGVATAIFVWNSPQLFRASTKLIVTPPMTEGPVNLQSSLLAIRALLDGQRISAEVLKEEGLDKPPYDLTIESLKTSGTVQVQVANQANIIDVAALLPDAKLAASTSMAVATKAVAAWRQLAEAGGASTRDVLTSQVEASQNAYKQASADWQKFQDTAKPELLNDRVETYRNRLKMLEPLDLDSERKKSQLAAAEKELAGQEKFRTGRQASVPTATGGLRDEALSPFMNPVYEQLSSTIATLKTEIAGIDRQRADIRALIREDDAKGLLAQRNAIARESDEVGRSRAVAGAVLEGTTTAYSQAGFRGTSRTAQLQILDPALVPTEPQPRYRGQRILTAAALGFVLAALGAIAFELVRARRA